MKNLKARVVVELRTRNLDSLQHFISKTILMLGTTKTLRLFLLALLSGRASLLARAGDDA